MQEIISKRTRNSKTFDLGNGQRQVDISASPLHFYKNRQLVDIDCNWKTLVSEFNAGDYPYDVRLNKSTKTLTIISSEETVTITPQNIQSGSKITVSVNGNTISLAGLWKGITCYFTLTPIAPLIEFEKTATIFTNPQMLCSNPTPMRTASYLVEGKVVQVPTTENAGVVTYDFTNVPLNTRVN